jgi:hypothetical protein
VSGWFEAGSPSLVAIRRNQSPSLASFAPIGWLERGHSGHRHRNPLRRIEVARVLCVNLDLNQVGVQPPVGDIFQALKAVLRDANRMVRTLALGDLDHPLQNLERVSVRAQQIFEESYPIFSHETHL